MTENFTCLQDGKPVERINMLAVLGIRFLEHQALGYLLIGLLAVLDL
jgi:hypothetical protein